MGLDCRHWGGGAHLLARVRSASLRSSGAWRRHMSLASPAPPAPAPLLLAGRVPQRVPAHALLPLGPAASVPEPSALTAVLDALALSVAASSHASSASGSFLQGRGAAIQ